MPALYAGLMPGIRMDGITVGAAHTHGIHPGRIEAMAFAWPAQRHREMQPGNLPSVTGAREAVVPGTAHEPECPPPCTGHPAQ